MAIDFSKLDGLKLGELALALESETSQSAGAIIAELRRRLAENGLHLPSISLSIGDPGRVEWSEFLRTGRAFALWVSSAAVAANFSFAQLQNAVGSGKNIIVQKVIAIPAAASDVVVGTENNLVAGAVDLGPGRNLNGVVALLSTGHVFTGAAAGSTPLEARYNNGTLESTHEVQGGFICELAPGQNLSVQCNTLNTAIEVTFIWAEVDAAYPR